MAGKKKLTVFCDKFVTVGRDKEGRRRRGRKEEREKQPLSSSQVSRGETVEVQTGSTSVLLKRKHAFTSPPNQLR